MSIIVEDEAVILRSTRYSETSRIVVFLSGRYGKLHGIAKGARGPRSRFGAGLDVLAESRLVIYLKPDRDLHLVSTAALIDGHDALLRHPVRYHFGCAVVEYADRLVLAPEEGPERPALVRRALRLAESAPVERLPAVFKAYQLRFAVLMGYQPHITGCMRCGASRGDGLAFAIGEGGLVCRQHRDAAEEIVPLSEGALAVLRQLVLDPQLELHGAWSPRLDSLLTRIVVGFLRYHIDAYRGLRSLKSLHEMGALHAGRRLAGGRRP
ncbi:MAG: DNA repair protein RecO [Candidatus Eisenbacteria bacterium]|nr:DNA repair protein RecO [Candidatus Eisenbacteria bacterium]